MENWRHLCLNCRHLVRQHQSERGWTFPCGVEGCECVYVAGETRWVRITTATATRMGLLEDVQLTSGRL